MDDINTESKSDEEFFENSTFKSTNDPWKPQKNNTNEFPKISAAPDDPLKTMISSETYVELLVLCQDLLEALAQNQLGGGSGGSGTGQMIADTIRGTMVRSALSRAVKFVIGETATPSPEMINYGMAMRSEPRTQEERDVYLTLMKKAAHETPDALMNYIKADVSNNGTVNYTIDYYALDADITRRALLYQLVRSSHRQQRQQERERQLKHEATIAEMQAAHEQRLMAALGFPVTSGFNFDSFGGPSTPTFAVDTFGGLTLMDAGSVPLDNAASSEQAATLQAPPTSVMPQGEARTDNQGFITLLDILIPGNNSTATS